jgi:hypothetical protein
MPFFAGRNFVGHGLSIRRTALGILPMLFPLCELPINNGIQGFSNVESAMSVEPHQKRIFECHLIQDRHSRELLKNGRCTIEMGEEILHIAKVQTLA